MEMQGYAHQNLSDSVCKNAQDQEIFSKLNPGNCGKRSQIFSLENFRKHDL